MKEVHLEYGPGLVMKLTTLAEDFRLAELLLRPGFSAVSFPAGDVALGDIERADDVFLRDVVKEHAVDHIAHGFGEAGDLAVAGLFGSRYAGQRREGAGYIWDWRGGHAASRNESGIGGIWAWLKVEN